MREVSGDRGSRPRVAICIHPFCAVLGALYFAAGMLDRAAAAFGAVLLHELGHVAAAHRAGVRIARVELFPFGGVARLEGMESLGPAREIGVAAAGPLTSLGVFCLGLGASHYGYFRSETGQFFLTVNLLLAIFNLLPGLPLDGGRILCAWLAGRRGLGAASLLAARLGQCSGLIITVLGLLGPLWSRWGLDVAAVGLFVLYAATREKRYVPYLFVRQLMAKERELFRHRVLPGAVLVALEEASIMEVARLFHPGRFHLVAVTDELGKKKGVLSESEVITALTTLGVGTRVGSLLKKEQG